MVNYRGVVGGTRGARQEARPSGSTGVLAIVLVLPVIAVAPRIGSRICGHGIHHLESCCERLAGAVLAAGGAADKWIFCFAWFSWLEPTNPVRSRGAGRLLVVVAACCGLVLICQIPAGAAASRVWPRRTAQRVCPLIICWVKEAL
jgi:hypothetical protein